MEFNRRAEETPIDAYDGFSFLKAFLKQQKAQGVARVPRLMLKYMKIDPTKRQMQSSPHRFPQKLNENEITSVSFVYEDFPLPGWRKELLLKLSGKTSGQLDVVYVNPTRDGRFKAPADIRSYFEIELSKLSAATSTAINPSEITATVDLFDFKPVFCICQCSEDPYRSYLEFSYGKIGCSKWIHPECCGLGTRSKQELDTFPKVICPFCTAYIRGCQYESFVPKKFR